MERTCAGFARQAGARRRREEGLTGGMHSECQTDQHRWRQEQEAHEGLAQGLTLQTPG